jgi:thioredoxin reductase (NADPH)
LEVIVLDCRAFGGQAGASSRIENYLGFPTGISEMALMARAYNQAQKFGAEMVFTKTRRKRRVRSLPIEITTSSARLTALSKAVNTQKSRHQAAATSSEYC